jgi:hypothetical protein
MRLASRLRLSVLRGLPDVPHSHHRAPEVK